MTWEAQELRNREAAETICVTGCPTCGALAQAIGEDSGITYRYCQTGNNPHAVYDLIAVLYAKTFKKNGDELSVTQMCEQLLDHATKGDSF